MKVIHQPTPEQFLEDVKDHKLTVIRNDGLYRHIRLAKPGTRCESFELVTWPGHLAYTGDMGSYVFTRLPDMFEFFRRDMSSEKWARIDMRYWAEKCESRDRDDVKEFDADAFKAAIHERRVSFILDEGREHLTKEERREFWDQVTHDILERVEDDRGEVAHHLAYEFSYTMGSYFSDRYQSFRLDLDEFPRCERYTYRFVWCCYALDWGIGQFDKLGEQQAVPA